MALLSTYYDYELKKSAYILTGEKGYARNTTTLLTLVSVSDTTMDYCTATFKVNVLNDRADSQIVFYDNNVLIPFTYNNTEQNYLEWSNQDTSEVTVTIKLPYEATHSIVAKYMGNIRCTQSKSKKVTIIRPKPATAQTELTLSFSNANRIYTSITNPSVTATLTIVDDSINPNANRNQTIEFYIDGVLNGTSTTNNSGVASYTLSDVTVGLHTVTAIYDGSEYLFKSETSAQISKGYQIDILDYPSVVLNDDDITVTAQLSDFFENPISEKTLTFAKTNSSHTSLSVTGTTDSDGKATISMGSDTYLTYATGSNNIITVPYCIRYTGSEYSEHLSTLDGQNMLVELDSETEYISATNQITEINGVVSPQRTGIFPVEVSMSANGVTETVKTNSNGLFTYKYKGIGVGDTTATASINSVSDSVDVEDLVQYWNANNVSWNKQYKWVVGEFRELTNGFKLELPSNVTGGVLVGLGDGTVFEHDWELSFKIVASSNITQFGVEQWKKASPSNQKNGHIVSDTTVTNGDVIKAISEEGTLTVYKNDTVISTTTATNSYPAIWCEGNARKAYILFDNLKLKVIA